MKKIIPIVLLLMLTFITACEVIQQNDYSLVDISREKTDLDHNERNDNLRIFFGVSNNADLTLNSKIEVLLNEDCFSKIQEKELGEIPPHETIRSFVTIKTDYNLDDECVNKPHEVTLVLKDVNGKILDSEIVSIGIV